MRRPVHNPNTSRISTGSLHERVQGPLLRPRGRDRAARPTHPQGLFDSIAGLTDRHDHAVEVATEHGQAAIALAEHYATATATDASDAQIREGERHDRVRYRVAPAEDFGLPSESADLITVAQALHWFDHRAFFAEAERVLRPGGLLAVWLYRLFEVTPEIEEVVLEFYSEVTGPYWPPERAYVDQAYR